MRISKHLSLAEVTRSETAKRNGIDNKTLEYLFTSALGTGQQLLIN